MIFKVPDDSKVLFSQKTKRRSIKSKRVYGAKKEKLTEEYLTKSYLTEGKSIGEIAAEAGCSRTYIHKCLVAHGIKTRNVSNAWEQAWKNPEKFADKTLYTIKEVFFGSWREDMAYVLGLLFTDGTMVDSGKQKSVRFSQKDVTFLEQIKDLLGSNHPIEVRRTVSLFTIGNREIYRDLLRLGLTPQKSLTMQFPEVPQPYVRHFIRGCWDGDGSVFLLRKGGICASYVCGSLSFIEHLGGCPRINMDSLLIAS